MRLAALDADGPQIALGDEQDGIAVNGGIGVVAAMELGVGVRRLGGERHERNGQREDAKG
jgi:hypothetical protein